MEKEWPECYKDCELVKELGVGECESCCPEKFTCKKCKNRFKCIPYLKDKSLDLAVGCKNWEPEVKKNAKRRV